MRHAALKLLRPVSDITLMPPLSLDARRKTQPGPWHDAGAAPWAPTQAIARTGRSSTRGGTSSGLRLEAAPPSLRHAPDTTWQRFMFWLFAPAPQEAAPPRNRLPQVREDFMHAVADVPGHAAHALRHRIMYAQSLRELWHLRADVFSLIGVEHAQSEAEQRMLHLNRHFPVRTARRSQFGSLGGS